MITHYHQLQVMQAEMHIQPHVTFMQLWKKKRSVPLQPSVADRVGEAMFTRLQQALCRLALFTAIWIVKSIFFWNMKVNPLTDPFFHINIAFLSQPFLFHINTVRRVWWFNCTVDHKVYNVGITMMEIKQWLMQYNWDNGWILWLNIIKYMDLYVAIMMWLNIIKYMDLYVAIMMWLNIIKYMDLYVAIMMWLNIIKYMDLYVAIMMWLNIIKYMDLYVAIMMWHDVGETYNEQLAWLQPSDAPTHRPQTMVS